MRISDWSSDVCSSDLGERALATHVDAGGGVDARRLSGDPRRGQLPGGLGRDARDGRDAVGVVAGDELAQAVDVGAVAGQYALVQAPQAIAPLQQRGETVTVGAGPELDRGAESLVGRRDPPGFDD